MTLCKINVFMKLLFRELFNPICIAIFSVAKATLQSQMSVIGLSVCLSVTNIIHQAYQPSQLWATLLSAIMPISHYAYCQSCLLTYIPIGHYTYWPSCISIIKPINHHAYEPSCLWTIMTMNHNAYWLSCLSAIMLINNPYSKIFKLRPLRSLRF